MNSQNNLVRRVNSYAHVLDDGSTILINLEEPSWLLLSTESAEAFLRLPHSHEIELNRSKLGLSDEMVLALVRKGFLELDDTRVFAPRRDKPIEHLSCISLNVTKRCNLNCSYCYAKSDRLQPSNTVIEMSKDIAEKSVELAFETQSNSLAVILTGGEPLLWGIERILELSSYISVKAQETGKKTFVILQTNGTLLTEDVIRRLLENRIRVRVSLDIVPEVHDQNRPFLCGGGSYHRVRQSLGLLSRSYQASQPDLIPTIECVVTNQLLAQSEECLKKLANELIEFDWCFQLLVSVGRLEGRADNYEDYEKLCHFLLSVLDYSVSRKRIFFNIKYHLMNILATVHDFPCFHSPCGAGKSMVSVCPDGSLYPCDNFMHDTDFLLGNITNCISIRNLTTHEVVERLQGRKISEIDECSLCHLRQFCNGGCAADAYYSTGDLFSPAPTCRLFKLLLPELMRRLALTPSLSDLL